MAVMLSVSERTVRNWRKEHLIPFTKIRRAVLYDPAKVAAALEKFERNVR
jgi:hypothetical protein